MKIKKTVIFVAIPAVCGFASVVSANDVPSMGRTGNFDYTVCGGFPVEAEKTAATELGMGGTNMGMSATQFCECVRLQVGESVREKINCGTIDL